MEALEDYFGSPYPYEKLDQIAVPLFGGAMENPGLITYDARNLLARPDEKPEPPENPMSADRIRWEHIQRVYELCNRNVSETARRLNMHRRTLQRILAKRAPR